MGTIANLRSSVTSNITQNGTSDRIEAAEVRATLTSLIDELRDRGVKTVTDTASLATIDSNEAAFAFVDGKGLFSWAATGTPDGSSIFAGLTGVWKIASATSTGSTSSAHAVTSSYCDTVGATTTERNALLQFTSDLESAGIYSKLVSFYPFVGTSELLKRRNMLDPADTDAAFRLTVAAGAPTSVTKGVQLTQNGVDKYSTGIDPTLIGGQPNIGIGMYFPVITNAQVYANHANLTLITYDGGYIWAGLGNPSTGTDIASTNTYKNHWFFQRNDASTVIVNNQASNLGTLAFASSGLPAYPITFFIRDSQGAPATYSAFYVTKLLTNTEYQSLNTALNNLMTTLGRTA